MKKLTTYRINNNSGTHIVEMNIEHQILGVNYDPFTDHILLLVVEEECETKGIEFEVFYTGFEVDTMHTIHVGSGRCTYGGERTEFHIFQNTLLILG